MPIIVIRIQYGFSGEDSHTHIQRFWGGDNTNHLGGSGELDMTDSGREGISPMTRADQYVFPYLKCLQEVAQPDLKVISAGAEQYSDTGDWGTSELQYTSTYDVVNFAPKVGNTPGAGPRGRAFIAGRQPVAATRRYGWTRWHYISGSLMTKPTLMTAASISSTFYDNFVILRNVGSQLGSYCVLSGALSTVVQPISKAVPADPLHFGIRNG